MRANGSYLALGLIAVGVGAWAANNGSAPEQLDAPAVAAGCARQFERAQRVDMESFRDYDAETFRAGHISDTVTVFASGAARYGIDAVMEALRSHFENREAVWAWTEKYRVVDGCKTAFILYETTYDIPSNGYHQRALTGVTYTYRHGKWLAVADTGTLLPN
ncbi:hypothetical protein [Peristeroidobacter agariperforans]|uniref:hypothetical protein n=1 Tax=Peristeroidobacter agariperforans TaxID=268404 RepID=UPI00101C5B42|nr:hypothetical protein [Peristeroidobacter agariperforans]